VRKAYEKERKWKWFLTVIGIVIGAAAGIGVPYAVYKLTHAKY